MLQSLFLGSDPLLGTASEPLILQKRSYKREEIPTIKSVASILMPMRCTNLESAIAGKQERLALSVPKFNSDRLRSKISHAQCRLVPGVQLDCS